MASGLLSKEVIDKTDWSEITEYVFSHEDHAEVFCDNVWAELCPPLGDWARQRGKRVHIMRCKATD